MKYRAKETQYMSDGSGKWLIKGKVYDLKKDVYSKGYYFKSEISDNHAASVENLDKYFEKVEEGMKFKVGDNVVIKKSLEAHKDYGKEIVSEEMLEYLGKSANIVDTFEGEYLLDIDEGCWCWTDEMLEPAQELKLDIKNLIGKVVHCDTEAKANQLLEYLDGQGYKWRGVGKRTTKNTFWDIYEENTCYCVRTYKDITYGNMGCFKANSYDIIEFEDLIQDKVQDRLRICEIIGKNVGEKFIIRCLRNDIVWHINEIGLIVQSNGAELNCYNVCKIINNPDLIEDIPTAPIYTDRQKEIFKALKVLGFKYIAKDKSNDIVFYTNKPYKTGIEWDILDGDYSEISQMLNKFPFISWEDDEPFDLVKALESNK